MASKLMYLTQPAAFTSDSSIVNVQRGVSPPEQVNRAIVLNR